MCVFTLRYEIFLALV